MSNAGPAADLAERRASRAVRNRDVDGEPLPTRVLLIEDEELYQVFFKRLLRQAWSGPIELDICDNLADGLEAATTFRPDVILTDLTLPDSIGLDTVRAVARASESTPVIVLTGNDDTIAAVASLESGAQDYLVKGDFDAAMLARSIRHSMARAESEERLRQTANELARTNRDLKEYASLVAHDLRAPVRTGRLLADRLLNAALNGHDPAAVQDLADRLDRSMARLDSTVIRLLDYAGLHDHGMAYEDVDAATFLGETLQDLQAALDSAETQFVIDAECSITGDLTLLALVVRELVSNAVKYRAPDRPPRVVLACHRTAGAIRLTITDNGQGIAPEYRESVFGLFHRLHTQAEVEGLGFGLTYCRRIVDMHGGEMTIDDGPDGIGTSLHVVIPAIAPAVPIG